jgi:hypothetical protein
LQHPLYLVTRDARILPIAPEAYKGEDEHDQPHLYQEICPVTPLIASSLAPGRFCEFITNPANPVYVPRMFFADMRIDRDQRGRLAGFLPYNHPAHIEHCIAELETGEGKKTKTVDRHQAAVLYRLIRRGFYLGDQTGVKLYPFPSPDELDDKYHVWWHSATM